MQRITTLGSVLALLFVGACTSSEDHGEAMEESDWEMLTADEAHWRGYQAEGIPAAWAATDDGGFHFTAEGEGGDIVTMEQYDNFELELEWKLSSGGNSGIMFRVSEDHDYPWRTGPEFQILDNLEHPDAKEGADRMAGANYDMHGPEKDVVKPVGEWNHIRLVVQDADVEHWMNGEMIVSYQLWSDEWKERIANSKWIDMPNYGMKKMGHICLQDHGDEVWFRNIRIRRLGG